jgi:glycyl-tRNA synthetase beta chain
MASFLLELRTEEIPANALPDARRQLGDGLRSGLMEAGFANVEVRVMSTSLRLVALVESLPERQADRTERMTGPPTRIAFSEDGSPSKAAEGFARKAGVAVDELETESTDKGDYLAATVVHAGDDGVGLMFTDYAPSSVTTLAGLLTSAGLKRL